MNLSAFKRIVSNSSNRFLLGLSLVTFCVHFLINALTAYGYFRDELYYIACTEHLDIGYVDQPPFSIYVLAVNRLLFGDTLIALRLVPSLTHAITVLLIGLMTRQFKGGRFAQTLAATAALLSPIYLGMNGVLTMNCIDILVWTLTSYVFILILRIRFDSVIENRSLAQDDADANHPERGPLLLSGASRRMPQANLWLLLGLILGIGLLNKISVLWLGTGIAIGLLMTSHRAWLGTRWPWLAGALAFLIFLPYVIWNIQHDFAHLEFIRNASGEKYASLSPIDFIIGQIILQSPLSLPLWVAGLFFLLFDKEGKLYSPLGIVYLVAFLILVINGHSKPEYLSPAYGMLFAAGGVMFERFVARQSWRWLRVPYPALLALTGCVLAPLVVPLLPVEAYIKYQDALGVAPSTAEAKRLEKLPQFYADMFGWEEKAGAVARVFNTLAPEEKTRCAIFAGNYGRCGAIDFFGASYGLPKSIGNHNSYWMWGPREYTGEIVLVLGGSPEDCKRNFEAVTVMDTSSCTYCMPYENHLTISVCRKLKKPMREMWAEIKHFE